MRPFGWRARRSRSTLASNRDVTTEPFRIWQTPFLLFIASLVFQHVQASRKTPEEATSVTPKEPAGDLAAFAKSIGRIKLPQS